MKSRAFNAGAHVHNFFAAIGHGIAVGAVATKNTVTEFASGVKNGGKLDAKVVKQSRGGTAQTA